MQDFYALKVRPIWDYFKKEHFSFWMVCGYLFIEYVRPQSIIHSLDILPWGKLFVIFALIGMLADRQRKSVNDPALKWLIAYLVLVTLSSVLGYRPDISWQHFMDFFNWVVIFFLIVNIVNTEKRFYVFLLIFLVCCFKISLGTARAWAMRGFGFADWGLQGPPGYFENSGELSILMLSFGPIAYQLASTLRPHLTRLKYWLLMLMPITATLTIIGASSRGAQIAFIAQLLLLFLRKLSIRTLIIGGVIAWAAWALLPEEQKARFTDAGNDQTSQQRLLYWQHGRELILEHPGVGIGYFNFPEYYEDHFRRDMLFAHAELPHNIFIQVGTDVGMTGLFVYLMLIWRNFASTRKVRRLLKGTEGGKETLPYRLSIGFDTAFVGFLIAGQFVTVGYYPFMWLNLAMTAALANTTTLGTTFGARDASPSSEPELPRMRTRRLSRNKKSHVRASIGQRAIR